MSIKVLLVDDERLERVLVRKGFDWENNGFKIIGEASSGIEALEIIKREKPEIIFMDINMPYMDGLECAEEALKIIPECSIIILTGFREFEYARKAVKIGVKDFLLKPINIKDVSNTIIKIKEKILNKKNYHQEVENLRQSVLADKNIIIESFFQRLVERRINKDEAINKLKMYSFEGLIKQCICVSLELKKESNEETNIANIKKVVSLISNNDYKDTICFVHYMNNIIIYFLSDDEKKVYTIIKELHNQINTKLKIQVTVGISLLNKGYEGISRAYRQAEKAISTFIIFGRNRVISYQEYKDVLQQNLKRKEIDWNDFIFSVNNCLVEQVNAYVDVYLEQMKASSKTPPEYLWLISMNMISVASSTLNRYGKSIYDLFLDDEVYDSIRKISTIDDASIFLKKYLNTIVSFHQNKKGTKINKLVKNALSYVDENIFNPELSLKLVASKIFTNESYLSRVFKKEIGINLMEYILKKRIEESIRLLNTTDLKAYEIADKIGFSDPHYFSLCFKKQTGKTIIEYKKTK